MTRDITEIKGRLSNVEADVTEIKGIVGGLMEQAHTH